MGFFDPKAREDDVRREVSRLAGENRLLRQAVALLIRHSPAREQVLSELTRDAAVMRASARASESHPMLLSSMQDALESIKRMA